MKKLAAIKNAYAEYWEQLPNEAQQQALQNNGFIQSQFSENTTGSLFDCIKMETIKTYDGAFGVPSFIFRPITLKNIETNNGWISIESEEDLPKDYEISYHAWNSEGDRDYYVANMWTIINRYHLGSVTHYQPIEKPKPPIY